MFPLAPTRRSFVGSQEHVHQRSLPRDGGYRTMSGSPPYELPASARRTEMERAGAAIRVASCRTGRAAARSERSYDPLNIQNSEDPVCWLLQRFLGTGQAQP